MIFKKEKNKKQLIVYQFKFRFIFNVKIMENVFVLGVQDLLDINILKKEMYIFFNVWFFLYLVLKVKLFRFFYKLIEKYRNDL